MPTRTVEPSSLYVSFFLSIQWSHDDDALFIHRIQTIWRTIFVWWWKRCIHRTEGHKKTLTTWIHSFLSNGMWFSLTLATILSIHRYTFEMYSCVCVCISHSLLLLHFQCRTTSPMKILGNSNHKKQIEDHCATIGEWVIVSVCILFKWFIQCLLAEKLWTGHVFLQTGHLWV